MPDANIFKFNTDNEGKCYVTIADNIVHITRDDDHNETTICDVSYTFTAPKDEKANTRLNW